MSLIGGFRRNKNKGVIVSMGEEEKLGEEKRMEGRRLSEDKKEGIKLIKEYKNFIADKWDLRVYVREEDVKYRWLFGFPKELVEVVYPLLVTSPYWGEEKDCEDGDFWVWWLMIRTDEPKLTEDVKRKLKNDLKFRIASYNRCAKTIGKWVK